MVNSKEAIRIYQLLQDHGIQTWLTGGWGIDALVGKQSRPHKDLDVILSSDQIQKMCEIMQTIGYSDKKLWSENRVISDSEGNIIDTAFVLVDSQNRGFDVHGIIFDENGNGIPSWDESEDFIFLKDHLDGNGIIGDVPVKCITVESQIICHSGYEIPEHQVNDLKLLEKLSK